MVSGIERKSLVRGALSLLIGAVLMTGCSIELASSGQPAQNAGPAIPRTLNVPQPLPWADLRLSGALILIYQNTQLLKLDLVAGQVTILFQAPDNAWLSAASASSDGKLVVFAYAPPAEKSANGQLSSVVTQLFVVSADGSAPPRKWLGPVDPDEEFITPQWSADGHSIYYVHIVPTHASSGPRFAYVLERRAYPDGQPEVLVHDAIWPRLSPDGSKLAYVLSGTASTSGELYLADANGRNARRLVPVDTFIAVDSSLISPDNRMVVVSTVSDIAPTRSPLNEKFGVQVALAHSLPSDWWRIPASGGTAQRVTELGTTGLYGDFSPDGQHMLFICSDGLYFMNADGTGLTRMLPPGPTGTIAWIR